MSSSIRALSKHARTVSQSLRASQRVRAFHSPFAVLSPSPTSPVAAPPSSLPASPLYEKLDYSPEVQVSSSSTRVYVVSDPDPANTLYEVPSGAYPNSAPYQPIAQAAAPIPHGAQFSSSSSSFAHPLTTRAVPRTDARVGESAVVRNAEAPGQSGRSA